MDEVYAQLAIICKWLGEKTKKQKQQSEFISYMIKECGKDDSPLTYEFRLFSGTHVIGVKGHPELVTQIQWKDATDMKEQLETFMKDIRQK